MQTPHYFMVIYYQCYFQRIYTDTEDFQHVSPSMANTTVFQLGTLQQFVWSSKVLHGYSFCFCLVLLSFDVMQSHFWYWCERPSL